MEIIYYIFAVFLIVVSFLPFISNQHWFFRVWEFGRIQIAVMLLALILAGFFFMEEYSRAFWVCQFLVIGFFLHNVVVLIPYTRLYRSAKFSVQKHSESISMLSVNVYQFNEEYGRLLDLINETDPDIILTMETNHEWQNALEVIEKKYPATIKVALENTYGMHFYTRLKADKLIVNYLVADDIPSVEATLRTKGGALLYFFGVHPSPPSPTKEETSKERDSELLLLAKKIKTINGPVVVAGDFNNVAWARSSRLFRKMAGLIDPRIGRGFICTFHARYRLFRFPIDLFFHTPDVFIEEFKALKNVGSDHLPLYCRFFLNHTSKEQNDEIESLREYERREFESMR